MFRINKDENSLEPLASQTFRELGFAERKNLQEWVAKHPSCLGEDLLIVQKEFSGFSDTYERLDLLALDKQGTLVLIENKLDDTGRDVTWQALKYASYCSSLSKENIRQVFQEYLDKLSTGQDAKTAIADFLQTDYETVELNKGATQRIILVAANFRKEVTSTVLWLLNFKMRIQCFRVTPWKFQGETFLQVAQIIPTDDAGDYAIRLASKSLDEIEAATVKANNSKQYLPFWAELLKAGGNKIARFSSISASSTQALSASTAGLKFQFYITTESVRAELYIDRSSRDENKAIFDKLHSQMNAIEDAFGARLIWDRLDAGKASRIKSEMIGNPFDETQRPALMKFMLDAMIRLEASLKEPIAEIQRALASKSEG